MKAPWLKFFPGDWLRGADLRLASVAARGLWIDMLCHMHEVSPRGFLLVAGRAPTVEQIGRIAGIGPAQAGELLAELETLGVFSRDANGVIFNRRMVHEGEVSKARSTAGKKGGIAKAKQNSGKPPSKTLAKVQQTSWQNPSTSATECSGNALASSFSVSEGDELPDEKTTTEEPCTSCAQVLEFIPIPDWLVIEAEFIREWNALKGRGVCEVSYNAMPQNIAEQFRESWQTPGWLARARKAMAKFPLLNGTVVSLRQFLLPTTIDEIIGGKHDFESPNRNAATGTDGRRSGKPVQTHLSAGGRPVDPNADVPF